MTANHQTVGSNPAGASTFFAVRRDSRVGWNSVRWTLRSSPDAVAVALGSPATRKWLLERFVGAGSLRIISIPRAATRSLPCYNCPVMSKRARQDLFG